MAIRAGSKVDATDFDLPDAVNGYANSATNTITATTFTDLPTNACSVSITNPHPTANLLVGVNFGAWFALPATPAFTRICPRVSGSTTISAGVGSINAGPVGWGMIPGTGFAGTSQHMGYATYSLPTGTATFTMQAFKDSAAAGTHSIQYAVIHVTPLYYLF